jgi:hypothetical protein
MMYVALMGLREGDKATMRDKRLRQTFLKAVVILDRMVASAATLPPAYEMIGRSSLSLITAKDDLCLG